MISLSLSPSLSLSLSHLCLYLCLSQSSKFILAITLSYEVRFWQAMVWIEAHNKIFDIMHEDKFCNQLNMHISKVYLS